MTIRHSIQIITICVAASMYIWCSHSTMAHATALKLTSSNQLAQARTIQLREEFSVADNKGGMHPFFNVVIDIKRPDELRIEAVPVSVDGSHKEKSSFYLMSHGKEHEYNGLTNSYTQGNSPPEGSLSASQLWDMAAVAPILYPANTPKAAPDITRTSDVETLNGRKMIVITDSYPTRVTPGNRVTPFSRIWVDASTGFPYQKCEYADINGKVMLNLQLRMYDYVLNRPLPARIFDWKAPAGATLYNPPTLLNSGTVAPDFTVYNADGKAVHLSDFKGKTVVLDFWATWCGPCQASLPHLEKVYQQVKNQNVVVLAVCVWDTHNAFEQWIAAKKGMFSFNLAFDPAGRGKSSIATGLYKVTEIPTQYVIDQNGKIISSDMGYIPGTFSLENSLRKLGVTVSEPHASGS